MQPSSPLPTAQSLRQIRQSFLDYFARHEHMVVPSSALVPNNDPTLFFTNAGMVQFKDVFTGREVRPYARATTVQKCLRVSGKHNDLENVGRTPRHHTFFEMLGNFSFGNYFKREAIAFAWEWLTRDLGMDPARLWITVHHSDDEAWDLWHRVMGVPASRIQRLGDKDNFWAMGETGPCGPCSEIHYDHGPAIDPAEGGPGSESPRYVEIWNLVFMQYERSADGTIAPLPRPSIDTGAGLERIAAVLQGAYWNYDTDAFKPIIEHAASLASIPYGAGPETDVALRVIADHSRAAAFLVADGVMPGNEARSYVLRRILRRAIRYGVKLGIRDPFLWKTSSTVVDHMGAAYPELQARKSFIQEVIRLEEERFSGTLEKGLTMLSQAIQGLPASPGPQAPRRLPGDVAFRLYDTYGFPLDLTTLIAEERGAQVDEDGFNAAMEQQRALGRAHWKGSGEAGIEDLFHEVVQECPTRFVGYETEQASSAVHALVRDGQRVDSLPAGSRGLLFTATTPLYGESGGQVGDQGLARSPDGEVRILGTRKPLPNLHAHEVEVTAGTIRVGDALQLQVDPQLRSRTRLNHTATHLLHAALKRVLGSHVAQKGSLVSPDRLRFDFSHHKAMTDAEIQEVEDLVNAWIRSTTPVETRVEDLESARASGAEALFGEKYGDTVRVVTVEGFSKELCGGTHARNTGQIGFFKVVSEAGIAAGVRRVEAVTGEGALQWLRESLAPLHEACARLRTTPPALAAQVDRTLEDRRRIEKELEALKREMVRSASGRLLEQARQVGTFRVLAAELDGDQASLREEADRLRDQMGERAVVVLGSRQDGQVRIVATCSKDIAGKGAHAGKIIGEVARMVGGGGGGRPDMAQAGGKDPSALPAALERVYGLLAD